jgi:hypothetical protein
MIDLLAQCPEGHTEFSVSRDWPDAVFMAQPDFDAAILLANSRPPSISRPLGTVRSPGGSVISSCGPERIRQQHQHLCHHG